MLRMFLLVVVVIFILSILHETSWYISTLSRFISITFCFSFSTMLYLLFLNQPSCFQYHLNNHSDSILQFYFLENSPLEPINYSQGSYLTLQIQTDLKLCPHFVHIVNSTVFHIPSSNQLTNNHLLSSTLQLNSDLPTYF